MHRRRYHNVLIKSGRIGSVRRRPALTALAVAVVVAAVGQPARAAVLTWDSVTGTTGAQDGVGTWAAGGGNWFDAPNTTDNVTFTNGDAVTFGAGSGAANTVTINGTVATDSVTFAAPGSGNYSVVNGTGTPDLNLTTGATINVANAVSPTISATITGTTGFTKTGTGTLTFTGANTYTGTTTVSRGTLVMSTNNTANTTGYAVNDAATGANGTTLQFNGSFSSNRTGVGSIGLHDATPITVANQGAGTTTIDVASSSGNWVNGTVTLNKAVTLKSSGGSSVRAGFMTFSGPGPGAGNDTIVYDAAGSGNDNNWNTYEPAGAYVQQPNTFAGNVRFTGGTTVIQNKAYANGAYTNMVIPDTASVTIDAGSTVNFAWGTEAFDALDGAGTIVLSNTADVGGGIRTITVGQSGGSGNFTGVLSTSTINLVKNGTGTQVLGGDNTYTGTTTVAGGRLAISAAQRISTSSALILSGGTFDTGGFNKNLATLQVTANSRIDLGSGASVLTFTASNAQSWTGGTTLTIDNWSGSPTGGGTDQLLVGTSTSGLTATQLGQITFTGFAPGAQILSTGEIVPVPEPSAALSLLALPAVGLLRRRRA